MAFKVGHSKIGGRKRGVKNKLTELTLEGQGALENIKFFLPVVIDNLKKTFFETTDENLKTRIAMYVIDKFLPNAKVQDPDIYQNIVQFIESK